MYASIPYLEGRLVRTIAVSTEVRTENLPKTNIARYRSTSPDFLLLGNCPHVLIKKAQAIRYLPAAGDALKQVVEALCPERREFGSP